MSYILYKFEHTTFAWYRKVDRKLAETLSNFIAGHPEAALLFWFFGGFRCGLWLFFLICV